MAARIRTAMVQPGLTIEHLYQSVLYGPYRYHLGGTRADYSTSLSESVLYGPHRYDLAGTRIDCSTSLSESVLYGPYRYDLGGTDVAPFSVPV